MSSNREEQRLLDILDNVTAVQSYVANMSFADFTRNRFVVDAVERCLQRITEAVIKIGHDRMAIIAPEVPFDALRGLGNRLRHDYDVVDHEIIYATVKHDLPLLATRCTNALGS